MAEKMHSNCLSTSVDDQQTTVKLDNSPEEFSVRKQQQQQQDEDSENTSNEEKEEFQICSVSTTTNKKPSSVVDSADEHKTDNNKLEKPSNSSSSILKPSLLSKSSPSKSSDHNNVSILKPSNFTPLLNITSINNKEDNTTSIISKTCSAANKSSSINGEVKFVPLVKSEPQKTNNNSSLSATSASTFVFGQNLQERVISDNENSKSTPSTSNGTSSSSSSSSNTLLFSSAIKNTGDSGENSDNKLINSKEKDLKSLTDYAREYEESRANKRKYDQVETITGEEEETNILNITCKLFSFDKATSNWQERGRGKLRLNDCEIGSRLVFRAAGSLRVILNTKIWAEMTLERASERSVRLTALDSTGKIKVFLITSSIEESKQLYSLLQLRLEKEIVQQKRKKVVEIDDEEMEK